MTDIDTADSVSVTHRSDSDAEALAYVKSKAVTSARLALLRRGESAQLAASAAYAALFANIVDLTGNDSTRFKTSDVIQAGVFVPKQWQGIIVVGNRARVDVLAYDSYTHWDGRVRPTPTYQYKLLLVRSASSPYGWRLTAQKAAANEQG